MPLFGRPVQRRAFIQVEQFYSLPAFDERRGVFGHSSIGSDMQTRWDLGLSHRILCVPLKYQPSLEGFANAIHKSRKQVKEPRVFNIVMTSVPSPLPDGVFNKWIL